MTTIHTKSVESMSNIDADKVIESFGSLAPYTFIIIVLVNLFWVLYSTQVMSLAFAAEIHPHTCVLNDNRTAISDIVFDNSCETTITSSNSTIQWSSTENRTKIIFDPEFGITMLSDFELVCDRKWFAQLALSVYMAGWTFGRLQNTPQCKQAAA